MGLIVTGVLVAAFFMFLYLLFIIPLRNYIKFRNFPTTPSIPLLGHVIEAQHVLTDLGLVYEKYMKQYSRQLIWVTYWFPTVLLRDPKDLKKVLGSREHVQKGMVYTVFDEVIGTGAFNSPVRIWKKRRPHLEQAFHSKVLRNYPKVFNSLAIDLVKSLSDEGRCGGQVFNIHPYFHIASIRLLIEGAFGVKWDDHKNLDKWGILLEDYDVGTYISEYRMVKPWYLYSDSLWGCTSFAKRLSAAAGRSHAFFAEIKEKRKAAAKLETVPINDNPYPHFMDLLLQREQKNPELELTEKDFIFELMSLFIAGTDASSKTMAFAVVYLGLHKEYQDKVHAELDEVFGLPTEKDLDVTEQELAKLVYMEACIKETLRMSPPVSIITRTVGSDVHLDEKTVIPKGTEVVVPIFAVHRDPALYPEPDKYLPDRFLAENSVGRDPYSWIPFSAGPRNCLGPKYAMMEVKVALAHLLHRYSVEAMNPMESWKLHTSITISLEGGWNVRLTKRGQ